MYLSYGNVNLKIVRLLLCNRMAKYDSTGQDYLWTTWTISVEAIYTPSNIQNVPYTISTSQPNPPNVVFGGDLVFGTADFSSVVTDKSLRHALMQPHQKLILSYEDTWLVSPAANYNCDMNNGPLPLECTVEEVRGEGGLFLVRYTIETAVNECNYNGGQIPIILSNRYTVSTATDDNFFETRSFAGEAVFRADILKRAGFLQNPDSFRPNILPPMPVNCKRHINKLAIMPDGYTVQYEIMDVEQEVPYLDQPTFESGAPTGRTKRNVTSVECVVTRSYQQTGANQQLTTLVNDLRNSISSIGMFSNVVGQNLDEVTKAGFGVGTAETGPLSIISAELAFAGGSTALNYANSVLPVFTETVVCEVRGNRYSKKRELQALAFSVALGQLTNVNQLAINNGFNPAVGAIVGGLIGASQPLPNITNAAIFPSVDIPKDLTTVQNVIKSGIGQVINLGNTVISSLLKNIPTANIVTLEYDVFRKRVKVTLTQECSGLIDFIGLRTASGRASIYTPLSDTVRGGDWNGFFSTSSNAFDAVYSTLPIKNTLIQNPPSLSDSGNLIGDLSAQVAGIGPPLDNQSYSGSLLQLVVADLGKACKQVIQPLSATNELRSTPLSYLNPNSVQFPTTQSVPSNNSN